MFGKKIGTWISYRCNYIHLLRDLEEIYEKGEFLNRMEAQTIARRLFDNSIINIHQRDGLCQIMKLLFDYDLISTEFMTKIIDKVCKSKKFSIWVDVDTEYSIPPVNFILKQNEYLALFILRKLNVWNNIDNTCVITAENLTNIVKAYCKNIYMFMDVINDTHPKLFNLMNQNNLKFTLEHLLLVVDNNYFGTLEELDQLYGFFSKHGYNITSRELAYMASKSYASDVKMGYLIEILMPRYNYTFNSEYLEHILEFNCRFPNYLYGIISNKIDISESLATRLIIHFKNKENIIDTLKIICNFEVTATMIEKLFIAHCSKQLIDSIPVEKMLQCNLDIVFKYSYINKWKDIIILLLNSKFLPSSDTLIYMAINTSVSDELFFNDIIKLLILCGLHIADKDLFIFGCFPKILNDNKIDIPKQYIEYINIDQNDEYTTLSCTDSKFDYYMFSYPAAGKLKAYSDVYRIMHFINIHPNLYNKKEWGLTLLNLDPNLYEYFHDMFCYVPSFWEIQKIIPYKRRILMMKRFYSELFEQYS